MQRADKRRLVNSSDRSHAAEELFFTGIPNSALGAVSLYSQRPGTASGKAPQRRMSS